MNRFKFRVWNPDENKMMYFTLGEPTFPDRYLHQHKHPFQQFIGKLDIEGNEMWEGDLVELVYAHQTHPETGEKYSPPESFGLYEIIYRQDKAAFDLKVYRHNWMKTYPTFSSLLIADAMGICLVIGNIYENPELMPETKALL